jgi:hypothetical protein
VRERKKKLSFFLVSSTAFHFQARERKKILSLEMWHLGFRICDMVTKEMNKEAIFDIASF